MLRRHALRKIAEAQEAHLQAIRVEVPRRFVDRIEPGALSSHLPACSRKALEYCRRWSEDPHELPGPLLMGKSGTFKTHLVWATARMIHERAVASVMTTAQRMIDEAYAEVEAGELRSPSAFHVDPSRFVGLRLIVSDGAEIAHEVRSSVERRNLDEVIGRYRQFGRRPRESPLLIDDVEVMKLSDWLHEELYRIFDYRYQEAMPTMVATNLSTDELRHHLGDRITRRILDMTQPFILGK